MLFELETNKNLVKQLEMELGVAKMMITQHYENRRQAEMERDDLYQ